MPSPWVVTITQIWFPILMSSPSVRSIPTEGATLDEVDMLVREGNQVDPLMPEKEKKGGRGPVM